MRRWTFHALTVVLLLLCIASAALWVRGRETADYVRRATAEGNFIASSRAGEFTLEWNDGKSNTLEWNDDSKSKEGVKWSRFEIDRRPAMLMPDGTEMEIDLELAVHSRVEEVDWQVGWESCGVYRHSYTTYPPPPKGVLLMGQPWLTVTAHATKVVIPHWLCVLIFGALPAWRFVLWWRRRRRYAAGCCQSCGYDLRASGDACPECGAIAARASIE